MKNGELTVEEAQKVLQEYQQAEVEKLEKDKQEIFDFIKDKGYQLVINLLDPVVKEGKLKSNVYVDLIPLKLIKGDQNGKESSY